MEEEHGGDGDSASAAEATMDGMDGEPTGWWWPIGSMETSTENGKLFASGEPALGASSVSRVGPNGGSKWGISAGAHDGNLGLDVGAGSETNKYHVISIGNGTVKTVADGVPEGRSDANGGCGNYVEVDYGEIIVRFLHLYAGSIKVSTGDSVTYGQVIGKIGHNGDSTGPHSHTDYKDKDGNWLDPVDIVDPNDPRPVIEVGNGEDGQISLTTTKFDKTTFKKALQSFYNKTKNQYFYNNFLLKADTLYNTSLANNVNPELVVVTAYSECGFNDAGGGGTYNYWGIGAYEGGYGSSFSSFEEGIKEYANTLKAYRKGGSLESLVLETYEKRKNSGCDPLGYGLPGTFSGMQSVYSGLGKHQTGSSSVGGYYYLDPDIFPTKPAPVYATHEEFVSKCQSKHAIGSDTTPYENGQYTAWQVKDKVNKWKEIFGAYGSLASGNSGTSGKTGNIVSKSGDGYDQCYKSSTGRTYKEFEQWKGTYKDKYYWNGLMYNTGCSISAIATILSGYTSNEISPEKLFKYMEVNEDKNTLEDAFKDNNIKISGPKGIDKKKITSGKPALVNIAGTLKTEKGTKSYPGGHFIAILDGRVKNGKYQVYVADPGANNSFCGGWTDVDNFNGILGIKQVIYIES